MKKIRLADYLARKLEDYTSNVYMVTGGGAMHLNDAFGRSNLNLIFCHHEQACSMAAEAQSRLSNNISVVNVTTGPGGVNALNGVFGAWTDSIPLLIISGQVKTETLVSTYGKSGGWRQLGDQEVNIIKMVKGITKYSKLINDPSKIKFEIEKAIHIATSGRKGPVWLDIPIDVQSALIDTNSLKSFNNYNQRIFDKKIVDSQITSIIDKIKTSKRPVFYIGSGVHLSNTQLNVLNIAKDLSIPIVTAWNSNDLIEDESPLYVGRGGSIGNRSGNFVLQSSDLIIVLGSRLNIRLVSYNWSSFAPKAYKIGVDIDSKELNKPTCKFDLKIHSSLEYFTKEFSSKIKDNIFPDFTDWVSWGKKRLIQYPVCLPEYWLKNDFVNPYCFVDILFDHLGENEIVVCADGTACVVTFQGMKVKKGQRVFHNSGCASMGYELPASIGAYNSLAEKRKITCIAGDGSIMMNLQELQTISGNNYPIQIFILNNQGYHSIRQTQKSFFSDNIVGCGIDSGLNFPNFEKIADAFEFPYYKINNHRDLKNLIPIISKLKDRFICEINIDLDQHFSPKLSSKKLDNGTMITSEFHDMWPFLDEEELNNNIIN